MAKGRQRHKAPAAPPEPSLKNLSPEMKSAWDSFEAGDKVRARRGAKAVLAASPSELDAAQARELLERLRLPRITLLLGGMAGLFLLLLVLLALLRY